MTDLVTLKCLMGKMCRKQEKTKKFRTQITQIQQIYADH